MARWGYEKGVLIRVMVILGSWGHLGPSWAHLGAILGPSWAILGPSWSHLGPSWGNLGPSWGHLGPSWGNLGCKNRHCSTCQISKMQRTQCRSHEPYTGTEFGKEICADTIVANATKNWGLDGEEYGVVIYDRGSKWIGG